MPIFNNKDMYPLIIGRIPETNNIGGVGIFVSRLLKNSKFLNSNKYIFHSTKHLNILRLIRDIKNSSFVHFNGSNPKAMILVAFLCKVFNKKLILSIHGEVGITRGFLRQLENIAIKLSDFPVVGMASKAKAKSLNINTKTSSAFIPPSDVKDKTVDALMKDLPKDKKIFCTNANSFSFDFLGREIYGITSLVNFFKNLEDSILLVVDSSKEYSAHFKSQSLKNVIFITKDIDFCQLLKKSFCFIRYTSTDGDSVSIREALYFGIPVIASNCIERPKSCYLCNYDDTSTIKNAIKEIQIKGLLPPETESACDFYDLLYESLSTNSQ